MYLFQLLLTLLTLAIKVGLPILAIIFLIKGIKYLNKKNSEKDND